LSDAGVIIERAHEWDGVEECRGSVLLKGVRGKKFPEIFEKSIDKHKIDAILNAPSFASGLLRAV